MDIGSLCWTAIITDCGEPGNLPQRSYGGSFLGDGQGER